MTVGGEPHPGAPRYPSGVQIVVGEQANDCLLHPSHVVDDADPARQEDDGVADELAGAVPGDLTATIHRHHWGAVEGIGLGASAPSCGVDGIVLDVDDGVGTLV